MEPSPHGLPRHAPNTLGRGAPRPGRGKVWLIALGGTLLGCIGMGLLGVGAVDLLSGSGEPASAQERELLLTVEDVRPYMLDYPAEAHPTETAERIEHFDGSLELIYDYEHATPLSALYIQSGITVAPSPAAARQAYLGMELGMGIGLAVEGNEVRQEERPEWLTWGEESRCALLVDDSGPVGNFFIARDGERIFHVVVAGVFFDDPETLRELVVPHLEGMGAARR